VGGDARNIVAHFAAEFHELRTNVRGAHTYIWDWRTLRPSPTRCRMPASTRSGFHVSSFRSDSTRRTAGCGPACPVVWQGRAGNRAPYADSGIL